MAINARHVAYGASALVLAILVAIAAYALHLTRSLSLPIPTSLAAFTTLLPILAGLAVQSFSTSVPRAVSASASTLHPPASSRNTRGAVMTALLILEVVLATLAMTYTHPRSSLTCALHERWQALFANKDEGALKAVEFALQCCGLVNGRDMPWPFPSKDVDVGTCVQRYGWNVGCLEAWRGQEQRAGGMMFAVSVLVAVWQAGVVWAARDGGEGWRSVFGGVRRSGGARSGSYGRTRRAIGFDEGEEGFVDDEGVNGDVETGERGAHRLIDADDNEQEVDRQGAQSTHLRDV